MNTFNVRDEFKNLELTEIQDIAKNNLNPFAVCSLNIDGGLNISTIIRSAHNFGCMEVIVFGRTRFDRRGMVGSQNYTNITKVQGLDSSELDCNKFSELMEFRKYEPIFIETGGIPLTSFKWSTCIQYNGIIPCLVFGNENSGIPESLIKTQLNPIIVSVPMIGVQRSFNVASCASIVMWDLVKEMKWV